MHLAILFNHHHTTPPNRRTQMISLWMLRKEISRRAFQTQTPNIDIHDGMNNKLCEYLIIYNIKKRLHINLKTIGQIIKKRIFIYFFTLLQWLLDTQIFGGFFFKYIFHILKLQK